MNSLEKIFTDIKKGGATLATLLKVALKSRRPSPAGAKKGEVIIMGNGPSLRKTIDENLSLLRDSDTMAVNFAANTPEFRMIRPKCYVLADGHFFNGADKDANVRNLWKNLKDVDWDMTLYLPVSLRKRTDIRRDLPACVSVKYYNLTPAEGFGPACRMLFRKGLAMPRPRNVLIPSIMLAMREGFRRIVLVGADHSWSSSLWVDDNNRVISVQPHFYADNEKERTRVEQEYAGYHLHDILNSLTIAFRSYFDIAEYARREGIEIVNATPGSYIDAFPREKI